LLSFLNAELNRKTGNKNEPDFFFYRNVMNWALIFIIQEALIPKGGGRERVYLHPYYNTNRCE
jgi:hypothetical protein